MDPTDIDAVLVAGATGGTGREVLRRVGRRVDTVRALTRSAGATADLRAAGADEVAVDDLLDPSDLAAAVEGVDAVISAVGSTSSTVRSGPPFVDGAGNRALVEAAVDAGVDAFVMESAIGVGPEPSSPLASAFDAFIGPLQEAKGEAEAALRDAPIRHTVLRPGILTNGRRTGLVTTAEPGARLWGTVSRADVAWLMAAAPTTEGAADRTFEVVSTPRFPDRGVDVNWTLPR
ncbi:MULTISPECIES: SDR family oxidoreductase [unclassified Halorubrum]|uniref:SDR family oxidoreductase n=1 Tax=unclassified Halorubrum TaxID=2642239 RepID=UPI000B98F7BE|nr:MULTISPECIES: SDR family oxidoreductase [unclassified Halorubrum]OYR38734.1 3-beta hydroxysteroid dehydrogenase [Halorubrum sp. Hd13]OYR48613.1 3-beta hydroxysteroid dehydrogenase [Halorubrum sp. Ea8]